MNKKRKLLILVDNISEYRIATYNIIAKDFDLELGFIGKDNSQTQLNARKFIIGVKKISNVCLPSLSLIKYCKHFDAIIFEADMHYLNFCCLPFIPCMPPVLCWSIGFRTSYTRPYDLYRKHTFLDRCYASILNSCDAVIVYMDCVKVFWKNSEVSHNKIFVAPNTTKIIESFDNLGLKKTNFLFIGTLYKEKGVDKLIKAFKNALENHSRNTILNIVGDGPEKKALESYVNELDLSSNVIFHGRITDEIILSKLFSQSVLSFSPTQAGLSIPKSMGYGVPVVTKFNAITGGELYHISNGETGIIYKNDDDLSQIMSNAMCNPEQYKIMGLKAKKYYDENATVQHMANGVIEAVNYAINQSR